MGGAVTVNSCNVSTYWQTDMSEFVTGVIQQQVKLYDSPLEYQADIFAFLAKAQERGAGLVVFPALSPLTLVLPLASSIQLDWLWRRKRKKTAVSKLLEKAAATASQMMGGVMGQLRQLLEDYPEEIFDAYIDLFSAAALKFNTTIVAGSFYLREHAGSKPVHVSYVFGPNGMILGRQGKVHLSPDEARFCQPDNAIRVIDTPVGRLGLLIAEDVLYPEYGRILAYQGAEILVNLTACAGNPAFRQVRHAFLARVDENEVLGIQSALVGSNLFNPHGDDWVGQSALLQPFQLSSAGNGIAWETASAERETIIIQPMSLSALKEYWLRPTLRLRQDIHGQAYNPLTRMYGHKKTPARPGALEPENKPASADNQARLYSPFADDAPDNL